LVDAQLDVYEALIAQMNARLAESRALQATTLAPASQEPTQTELSNEEKLKRMLIEIGEWPLSLPDL
jgi:hypothetical protein